MADQQRNFQINVSVEGVENLDRIAAAFDKGTASAETLAGRITDIEQQLTTRFKQNASSQWVDTLNNKMTFAGSKVRDLVSEYEVLLRVQGRLAAQAAAGAGGEQNLPPWLRGQDPRLAAAGSNVSSQEAAAVERAARAMQAEADAAQQTAAALGRAAVSDAEIAAWEERIARNRAVGAAAIGAGGAGPAAAPADPRATAIGAALARDQEQVNALIARLGVLREAMERLPANQQQKLASQYQTVNDTIQRVIQRHQQLFAALERVPPRNLQQGMEQVDRVSAQTERDVLRLQQALNRLDSSFNNVGNAAQTGQRSMGYFAKAAENVLVYGTLYRVFSELTNILGELTKGFVTNTAEAQKFVAIEGRLVGSATEANKRLQEVFTQGLSVGIPLKDLEKLDQRLAELGITAETSQKRFGLSLTELRGALTDLSQLPGLDLDKVTEFFTRSADGANRLALSLASAGVTSADELKQYGVIFDKTSNNIISTSDQTTRAVLAIWRAHYSGLSEETAHTWEGVQTRTQNSLDAMEASLGKDIFARITARLDTFLTLSSDPRARANFEGIGAALGKIYDWITKANEQTLVWFAHTAAFFAIVDRDKYAKLADDIESGVKMLDQMQENQLKINETGKETAPIFRGSADAAESIRQKIAGLQAQLTDMRDQSSGLRDDLADALAPFQTMIDRIKGDKDAVRNFAADALVPFKDDLDAIRLAQQRVNEEYQAALRPIRDAEKSLERQYQLARQTHDLNRLQRDVERDKFLAMDIYSEEGRAAALRLPDELDRLQQQKDEIAYNKSKNALTDQQTALERIKQTTDDNLKKKEEADNAAIRGIEKTRDALLATLDTANKVVQPIIDNIKAAYKIAEDALTRQEHALSKQIHDLQAQAGTAISAGGTLATQALGVLDTQLLAVAGAMTAYTRAYSNLPQLPGGGPNPLMHEEFLPLPGGGPNPLMHPEAGMGGASNTTLTLILQDPNDKEWFRRELQIHKGDVQAVIVDLLKGNKR